MTSEHDNHISVARDCIIKVGRNAVLSQMVVSAQSLHGACLLVSNMDSLCNYVASLT